MTNPNVKTIPNVQLTAAERALLLDAHSLWDDPSAFDDDKVEDVKRIFQRVFAEENTPLLGSVFSDALVMNPSYNKRIHYAMVIGSDSRIEWQKALIAAQNFTVLSSSTSFEDILLITGTSPLRETEDATRPAA